MQLCPYLFSRARARGAGRALLGNSVFAKTTQLETLQPIAGRKLLLPFGGLDRGVHWSLVCPAVHVDALPQPSK